MAKFDIKGLDELEKNLSKMAQFTEEVGKAAVYAGAGIVADEIRKEIENLPVGEGEIKGLPPYASEGEKIDVISKRQKADLLESLGIAKIENSNGYIQTKIGFDGYGSVKTKSHPDGLPNALLARSINSGTSFMKKNPFVRRALNTVKKKAVEAMEVKVTEEVKKIMEG